MKNNTLTKSDFVTAIYERQNQTRAVVKDTFEILLRVMKQAIFFSGRGRIRICMTRAEGLVGMRMLV